jgi:hypothetical protein
MVLSPDLERPAWAAGGLGQESDSTPQYVLCFAIPFPASRAVRRQQRSAPRTSAPQVSLWDSFDPRPWHVGFCACPDRVLRRAIALARALKHTENIYNSRCAQDTTPSSTLEDVGIGISYPLI